MNTMQQAAIPLIVAWMAVFGLIQRSVAVKFTDAAFQPAGQYFTGIAPCPKCPIGKYNLGCGRMNNGTCAPCRPPAPGFYFVTPPVGQPRVLPDCPQAQKQCTCPNGTASVGIGCPQHDTAKCISCKPFYVLQAGGCIEKDSDGDGTTDLNDKCPHDPLKVAPGICNCSTADTDSDGDGSANCIDGCPKDRNKKAPGVCGCGNPDLDSDRDGVLDCRDGCPRDAGKTSPGACGCGTNDTDTDGDSTPDCQDQCPNDTLKTTRGQCGCGVRDVDSDGDGSLDCDDACPQDPTKVGRGQCDCGTADTDTDRDGTLDCRDDCPSDASKTAPGTCGCGTPDTDTDRDGTPDCNDACPRDANKTAVGACGCGTADSDSDGDGTPDCNDGCPTDDSKTAAGVCGCGVGDNDTDKDGRADCNDGCPSDASKTSSGTCGCGVADVDTDRDGTLDCQDKCPSSAIKTEPGVCGCNVTDTDSDGDGTEDCNDGCPSDSTKTENGTCGCGTADTDTDGDKTPDCNDRCPEDAAKTAPGTCGCGTADTDSDNDGTPDCNESNSIEVGTFEMTTGSKWETITFQDAFSSVPVVAVMPTTDGSDPATIYIKEVTTTGFKAASAEPYNKDGPHPAWSPEAISYIAVAPGTSTLLDGKRIQAGTKSTTSQMYKDSKTKSMPGSGSWDSISFSGFSGTPALLAQIQTVNNDVDFVPSGSNSYASPFLTVACKSVTSSGANIALERSEVGDKGTVSVAESIGWIAIEQGAGTFTSASGTAVKYASVVSSKLFKGWSTSKTQNFGIDMGTNSPLVVANKVTREGNNGGWFRLKARTSTSVTLVVDEDVNSSPGDKERDHVAEKAGIFAVSTKFYLQG